MTKSNNKMFFPTSAYKRASRVAGITRVSPKAHAVLDKYITECIETLVMGGQCISIANGRRTLTTSDIKSIIKHDANVVCCVNTTKKRKKHVKKQHE